MTRTNESDGFQETHLLVAFSDLTLFTRLSRDHSNLEVGEILSAYYEFVGDVIGESGGKVVKFIGDAALIIFDKAEVDRGVRALKALKDAGDAWMADRNLSCRHVIKVHFGQVACGQVGTQEDKRFDVFGDTVNTAATLNSGGFAMTPQVFRKLAPETRKLFKKHTPPVTYIPVEAPHRD